MPTRNNSACFVVFLILRTGQSIREYTVSRPRLRLGVFSTGLERESRHWKSQRRTIPDGCNGRGVYLHVGFDTEPNQRSGLYV